MKIYLIFALILLPLILVAETLTLTIDLPYPKDDDSKHRAFVTAPGRNRLPVQNVNIVLPAGAMISSWNAVWTSSQSLPHLALISNPAFASSERVLKAEKLKDSAAGIKWMGQKNWGDITYAAFALAPGQYSDASKTLLWHSGIRIDLEYTLPKTNPRNRIPGTLVNENFFANPQALRQHYRQASQRNYDYLIISTPQLYAAAQGLESFRQSQGMVTAFTDVMTILDNYPGANDAAKIRNYLIQEYAASPFTYLLLIGDVDVIPIAMLTPEPNGSQTVPSDFYYSDLSSNFDSDNDGRLGEYSTGIGNQDWEMDFSPEIFVGRISNNNPAQVSAIAQRIVSYEQSTAPWKQELLLPAAFLNYAQEEYNLEFAETDGAYFMEFMRSTILQDYQSTAMYEQLGVVPSYPGDYPLDYDGLKNLLSSNSFGIVSWSAHGSATSASRKVWMEDSNANSIPDSWEMQWMGMVNRASFDNLQNQDGSIIFCASCYNGQIDHSSASLSEYALQKKGVAVIGATRTGWYKIGWQNPGWGGLSSYNYHFLENMKQNGMSVGAAHSYANLLHTQYYLFGDPIDSDGIIWPELQNVYTYLLFGDPAVGHNTFTEPNLGEILVWEPSGNTGLPLVNAINSLGAYNVIYTDRLIPDYQYLHHFEAVFGLLGFGDSTYDPLLDPSEAAMLNAYLETGGKLYLQGDLFWESNHPLMQKFGSSTPWDHYTNIQRVRFEDRLWDYNSPAYQTQALAASADTAVPIFYSEHEDYFSDIIGVFNTNGSYRSIASSFELQAVDVPDFDLLSMVSIVFDTLRVGISNPVAIHDDVLPVPQIGMSLYPNPFSGVLNIQSKNPAEKHDISIFNLRGQRVYHAKDIAEKHLWNAVDSKGHRLPVGLYIVRISTKQGFKTAKVLLM